MANLKERWFWRGIQISWNTEFVNIMVKNAHFSRNFGENCKKTTRKRSFFLKLNNFLRILYVDQHIFTTLIDLRCFPLFLNKFLSRISRKKDIFKAKKLLFWQKLWKNDAKTQFYAFFYVFTTLMGLKCLPLFLHKFHKMCRLWGKKPTFLAKTVKKRREKAVFFSNKKLFGTFSMISSMFLPLWVIWGEETEYSKR